MTLLSSALDANTRLCPTCNTEFTITKHQKTKRYCSDRCSKGWTQLKQQKEVTNETIK